MDIEHAQTSDYEQIRTLISAYCHLSDRAAEKGEIPDLRELFHSEAELSYSFENWKKHVGLAAVHDWYRGYLAQRAGYYRFMRHKIFEPYITIRGDSAAVSTHFDADSIDFGGVLKVMSGRYDDVCVKHEGRWLIKTRRGHVHYVYDGGPTTPYRVWR